MKDKILTAAIVSGEDGKLSIKVTADKISTYDLALTAHALMAAIADKNGCSIADVAIHIAYLPDREVTDIKY